MEIMKTKQVGFIIVGISVMLLVVMISFIKELQTTLRAGCACPPGACPMESNLPVQGYLGFTLIAIIGVLGGILVLTSKKAERLAIEKSEKIQKMLKTLKEEEKRIHELIESSDGVIFQSDLVDRSGYSKVKVSRILDKLESKGLVERRRRGMTNVIILKHGET
jgi:uncharacterized membrane protein